jgi:hypothetical protein
MVRADVAVVTERDVVVRGSLALADGGRDVARVVVVFKVGVFVVTGLRRRSSGVICMYDFSRSQYYRFI